MRYRLVLAASAVLLFTASAAPARQQDNNEDPCSSRADLTACWAREAERADEEMKAAYESLLAKLSSDAAGRMKRSQKAWLGYRDAHLALLRAATRDQHAKRPLYEALLCVAIARRQLALERTRELKHLLDPGSDEACPL